MFCNNFTNGNNKYTDGKLDYFTGIIFAQFSFPIRKNFGEQKVDLYYIKSVTIFTKKTNFF